MEFILLPEQLSVFQIESLEQLDLSMNPLFIGSTADELSIVAPTKSVPTKTINQEDGWRALKINGVLDFSLVGILYKIATLLTEIDVSIFAVSTYNTDYILIKETNLSNSIDCLRQNQYVVSEK